MPGTNFTIHSIIPMDLKGATPIKIGVFMEYVSIASMKFSACSTLYTHCV